MIWDTYKQKLIVNSNTTLYVIGISKNIIEFWYENNIEKIVEIQLIPNKNILSVCSYQSCTTIDYDYLISDNKDIFPNQLNPRFYKVNEEVIFHLNDKNSQATLFKNKKIQDKWIRNNLNFGNIRIVDNDISNLTVFAIFDNEISILDLRSNQIIQTAQLFLSSSIISIISENDVYIFLQTQSQQILTLQKKQSVILINEAIILPQGIAQYNFIQSSNQLIFTDFSNSFVINIVNFSLVQNIIKGQQTTTIKLGSRIIHFTTLDDTKMLVLLENTLILYDISQSLLIQSVSLPIRHIYSNIKIDSIYQRIFIQNQNTGSLIYDYNLVQPQFIKQINSFSTDILFDQLFIYSVNGHSANIYFRKDLKFLKNFRHFEMDFWLKKITYLGIGYLFIVEFLNKLSVYEFSPFIDKPIEKDFVSVNQFTIIDFKLQKSQNNQNDYTYEANVIGLTQEGMFTYTLKFDLYNQDQIKPCTWSFPFQQEIFQEANLLNQMTQQLSEQNRTLDRLIVTIKSGQILRLPNIPSQITSSSFGIYIIGKNGDEILYIENSLNAINNISFLKFKNMNIQSYPQSFTEYIYSNKYPKFIEINQFYFPILKQFILENIVINEAQIKVNDISQVIIKNLVLSCNKEHKIKSLTKIQITNSDYLLINNLIIDQCEFYLQNPLLNLINIRKVVIKSMSITSSHFYGKSPLFYFENIDSIEIGDMIVIYNTFNETPILYLSTSNILSIQLITLKNTKLLSQNYRLLNEIYNTQNIVRESIQFVNIGTIQINSLNLDQFSSDQNQTFKIFSIKNIKTLLSINESKIINISIDQKQNGIIFSFEGIYEVKFNKLNVQSIQFIQLLLLDAYQLSEINSSMSYIIQINQAYIVNYEISKRSILDIQSFITQIHSLKANLITFSPNQNIFIPTIKIKATKQLNISHSNFQQIQQFNDSLLQIYESKNVVFESNLFQNINSFGSGSAISIISSNEISINKCNFQQSIAKFQGGAIIFKNSNQISIQENKFDNNQSLKSQGGSIYSIQSIFNKIVSNSFDQNESLKDSGGAIYCQQGSIQLVDKNQFNQNQAINGSGGAIFLNNCDLLQLTNNLFYQNYAFIGGAIRYQILRPLILINNSIDKLKKLNKFKMNKCVSYGKDIGSYPIILDVKNSFDDDNFFQNAVIENVQSGYKSENPIYLRLIDEEMAEINFVDFKYYNDIISEITDEFSHYFLYADSDEIGLLGDLKQGYTKEVYAFIFDLSYSYFPRKSNQIKIKSTQSLPQFINGSQIMTQKQFEIPITIKFRECQIGEVLQNSSKYVLCFSCEQGFYSIVNPYSSDNLNCKRCPFGSIDCKGQQIQVDNGYWKIDENSDIIIYCQNNPQSCQSQNTNTKFGCVEGFKGPLCEECDTNGEVWGKRFAKTGEYSCMNCEEFNSVTNIILFIIIFAFILSQLFLKAYKQIIVTNKYIVASYLSYFGFISPNIQRTQTEQASLMKILLNYFQFIMIVNSLGIQHPVYFTAFNLSGGDTSQQTINRIDCYLFKYQTNLPNYIIRVFWVNFQPICLFFFLEIISQYTIQNTNVTVQRKTFSSNLIIVFSFFQPSITKVLSQSFSCRKIGSEEYILSDLNQKCLTHEHLNYFYIILLPLGIIWILFGPIFLFYRMRFNKHKMNTIKIIYRYGYLYQEYKLQHYYWDILRIFIRSFAIISINVLSFRVLFKGFIIFGLIYSYMLLSHKMKPYRSQKFNKLDKESCFLVIITLYLIYVGNFSENIIISSIMTICVAILNGKFLIKIIGIILIKPISPNKKERNTLQECLFILKSRIPFLFGWIEISNRNRIKSFLNWKKVHKQFARIKQINYESQTSKSNKFISQATIKLQKLQQQTESSQRCITLKTEGSQRFITLKTESSQQFLTLKSEKFSTLRTEGSIRLLSPFKLENSQKFNVFQ